MSAAPQRRLRGTKRSGRKRVVQPLQTLMARGEPMVWLTGGGLAVCLAMVLVLLAYVVVRGLETFWPHPIERLELVDGTVHVGEETRSERFVLTRELFDVEPPVSRAALHAEAFPRAAQPRLRLRAAALEGLAPAVRDELVERLGTIEPEGWRDLDLEAWAALPSAVRRATSPVLEYVVAEDGPPLPEAFEVPLSRRQIRTENFELTDVHAHWVRDAEIRERSRPAGLLTVERLEDGRFYGALLAYVRHRRWNPGSDTVAAQLARDPRSRVVVLRYATKEHVLQDLDALALEPNDEILHVVLDEVAGTEAAWERYRRFHGEVRTRHDAIVSLKKSDIGRLSKQREDAREVLVEVGLDHPRDSRAYREAEAAFETRVAELDRATARIEEQIAELERENRQHGLWMEIADGRRKLLELVDVVRAYPANDLGFWGRLGIYGSRWKEFLTADPRAANSEGGVLPAIFGTVVMTLLMCIVVVPFGVLAALYLREYAKQGVIVSMVRISVNNLAGVPSIVFGVFGLGFFCYGFGKYIDGGPDQGLAISPWTPGQWFLGLAGLLVIAAGSFLVMRWTWSPAARAHPERARWVRRLVSCLWLLAVGLVVVLLLKTPHFDGFYRARLSENRATYGQSGLLWAALTLALLTLPVVIVATEEALAAVPRSMREGSYACGASKWQTLRRIVLPRAMPGIMTGMILAMARGAGEVAPIMLVGVAKKASQLAVDGVFPYVHPERSFMHLGFHIYDVGFQSQNSLAAVPMVFTTTLLLIAIIVGLNLSAVFLRARLRKRFVGGQF